jgi:hypothetical protein
MGQIPDELDPDKVVRVGPLTAKLYETNFPGEGKQVAIHLEQTLKGTHQEMWCDLDRLEAVVDHGNALRGMLEGGPSKGFVAFDPQSPVSVQSHNTWTAKYFERTDSAGKPEILIRIDQVPKNAEGDLKRQGFAQPLKRLEEAKDHAVSFGQERGHERPWYAVLKVVRLAEDGVQAVVKVVRWDKEEPAQRYADENWTAHGYVLYDKPFRRMLGGEGYTFTVGENQVPKLGPDIRYLKAENERTGPGLVRGVWFQQGEEPTPGKLVKMDLGRDGNSREPTDYRMLPASLPHGTRPQGPNPQPVHIIAERDERESPPRWRVKEAMLDPERAAGRFQELKEKALEHKHQLEQRPEEPIDLSRAQLPKR